jgi:hypothetical protein
MTKINAPRVVYCNDVYVDLETIKEIKVKWSYDVDVSYIIIKLLKGHEYVNHPENGWTLIEPEIVIKCSTTNTAVSWQEHLAKQWEAYLTERDASRTKN